METLVININLANVCQKEKKLDTKVASSSPAAESEFRLNNDARLHMSRAKTYATYFRAMNVEKPDENIIAELTSLCFKQYREDKYNGLL